MWLIGILGLLGLFKVLVWVYETARRLFFLKPIELSERYGKNTWAVVTGGSEGIGLGIAKRLAKEGFNIVLIARNQEKLNQAKKQLHELNQLIDIIVVSMDFSKADKAEFYDQLKHKLEGLSISVLVNNVGMLPVKLFFDHDTKEIRDTVVVNCCSQTGMSKLLIPTLMKRSSRSAVIDLSSIVSYIPGIVFPVYHSTKAFNRYLSEGLASYIPNIDFLTVYPAMVSTHMILDRPVGTGSSFMMTSVSVDDAVTGIFESLGNMSTTNGAFRHCSLFGGLSQIMSLLPADILPLVLMSNKDSTLEKWKSF